MNFQVNASNLWPFLRVLHEEHHFLGMAEVKPALQKPGMPAVYSGAPATGIKCFALPRNSTQRCIQLNLLNSTKATDRTGRFACAISWHREPRAREPVIQNQAYCDATAPAKYCANSCTVTCIS